LSDGRDGVDGAELLFPVLGVSETAEVILVLESESLTLSGIAFSSSAAVFESVPEFSFATSLFASSLLLTGADSWTDSVAALLCLEEVAGVSPFKFWIAFSSSVAVFEYVPEFSFAFDTSMFASSLLLTGSDSGTDSVAALLCLEGVAGVSPFKFC
jgi:hypothetical protein